MNPDAIATFTPCGAHSRRSGQPCRSAPVTGSQRCRMHGGKGSGRPPSHGLRRERQRGDLADATAKRRRQLRKDSTLALLDKLALAHGVVDLFEQKHADGSITDDDRVALDRALTTIAGLHRTHAALIEAAKVDAPAGNVTFQVANVSGAGALYSVRGPDGGECKAFDLPDGTTLIACSDGAWRAAHSERDADQVERYVLSDGRSS